MDQDYDLASPPRVKAHSPSLVERYIFSSSAQTPTATSDASPRLIRPSMGFPPSPSTASQPSPARRSANRYDPFNAKNRRQSILTGKAPSLPDLGAGEDSDSDEEGLTRRHPCCSLWDSFQNGLHQVPAVVLIAIFHLMIGIPFGVSYFPMGWSPYVEEATEDAGPFPLPGKEALGIRMFLFSTILGQLVFTFHSGFPNPIGLQMVENVPFCHELAAIVIQHQGYGVDAISTLLVLFGLSSIVVGVIFWVLGKMKLGKIVYFFPTHVLVGCIGGIGIFIAKTGVEVTLGDILSFESLINKKAPLLLVISLEITLRILEHVTKNKDGKPKYSLLSPIYFCMITPIFYAFLLLGGWTVTEAEEAGYFFPSLNSDTYDGMVVNRTAGDSDAQHLLDMWTVIDFPTISWAAIGDSIPTLLALTLFSLIHVPINIPAFALSTRVEVDMNNELVAHGYSNVLAGMFGGLQNYMAYTQSVLYHKSGGMGRTSGVAVAAVTSALFFVGPTIASFIPRCMAGTLLIHVGLDLFMEGVYDSYDKFDSLEYFGIWLIVVVMTCNGMEAAMLAGVVAAVSTYAVQSVAYLSPVRGCMPGTTLRSSGVTRNHHAQAILSSPQDGRNRILVVQLQGHLFFGNMAHFTESMFQLMTLQEVEEELPTIVLIVDFSLVLGIDSSAAQAIGKLKDKMLKQYHIELCIFVTGTEEGFPTEYKLTKQLSTCGKAASTATAEVIDEQSLLLANEAGGHEQRKLHEKNYCGSIVCVSLDDALRYAEDALISRQDANLLHNTLLDQGELASFDLSAKTASSEEKAGVLKLLQERCDEAMTTTEAEVLLSYFKREIYASGDYLWRQHSASDSVKLLVVGALIAELENEAGTTETVQSGTFVGELGLLNGDPRMSSVRCLSEEALLYSMDRESFERLIKKHPRIARYIDLICINYLALRVQHVSNRIFETRCLPI